MKGKISIQFVNLPIFPSSALSASGSMGVISARFVKAPLSSLTVQNYKKINRRFIFHHLLQTKKQYSTLSSRLTTDYIDIKKSRLSERNFRARRKIILQSWSYQVFLGESLMISCHKDMYETNRKINNK